MPACPDALFSVRVDCGTFQRTCELGSGTAVTSGSLVPWLGQASVQREVFDGPDRVKSMGVRRRLFTGATRESVLARERECLHPSCDIWLPLSGFFVVFIGSVRVLLNVAGGMEALPLHASTDSRVAPVNSLRRTPMLLTRSGPSKTSRWTDAWPNHGTRLPDVTTVPEPSSQVRWNVPQSTLTLNRASGRRAPTQTLHPPGPWPRPSRRRTAPFSIFLISWHRISPPMASPALPAASSPPQ